MKVQMQNETQKRQSKKTELYDVLEPEKVEHISGGFLAYFLPLKQNAEVV